MFRTTRTEVSVGRTDGVAGVVNIITVPLILDVPFVSWEGQDEGLHEFVQKERGDVVGESQRKLYMISAIKRFNFFFYE